MKEREPIRLDMSVSELLTTMAEGNPGGLVVLMQLVESDNTLLILHLDDMNIRGSQIWVGYKDFCEQDISKFIENVKERSEAMVDCINENCASYGEIAVTYGASEMR